ncbi:hypothetical protein BFW38_09035 [Terasakiispira papahanaumokuakeensis]|uniref:Leucine rich repeat variant n=1 Tax=Terasakiispira papahanaumokuakeensis TaxID=197479 RepID=A0A1E2V9L7_9GAMM|nr:hypothetical protein [Terasakiispira papahanaumokuakeensis]ODC03667.1 hypothetical protein BFW38_09035 [Terasakiispira papahanaumokuakeensis]
MIRDAFHYAEMMNYGDLRGFQLALTQPAKDSVWQDIYTRYPEWHFWMLQNPSFPTALADTLANSDDVRLRHMAARKGNLSQQRLEQLIIDNEPAVRLAVSQRADLNSQHRQRLCHDQDVDVAAYARRHFSLDMPQQVAGF